MNRQTLNIALASTLLLAAATSAFAAGPATATPPEAYLLVDCAAPKLISQREAGELTGQANFTQVYATRTRLMAEVRRACRREGITRVAIVQPQKIDKPRLALQPGR
ncbi:MAG: hypothetical protein LH491_09825 [Pseudoxanthomonas sp.]|nr:hypothetical protein [Pseudoxanthomonas sp.]